MRPTMPRTFRPLVPALTLLIALGLAGCLTGSDEPELQVNNGANNGGNNGTANNGTANNGTANNGTANNGTANNGTANNGTANNGCTLTTFYRDADNDGYGDGGNDLQACEAPDGYVDNGDDCADGDASIHPDADEVPGDGSDQDCDGLDLCFTDTDQDGYRGERTVTGTTLDCSGTGEASAAVPDGDCDDDQGGANPGAEEVCDGIDNDCNELVDDSESQGTTFYEDRDGDGAGNPDVSVRSCDAPEGYVAAGGDCDDLSPWNGPGAAEWCGDEVDNNCNDVVDEGGCVAEVGDLCTEPLTLPPWGGTVSGTLDDETEGRVTCFGDTFTRLARYVRFTVPEGADETIFLSRSLRFGAFYAIARGNCGNLETLECFFPGTGGTRFELEPGTYTLMILGQRAYDVTVAFADHDAGTCSLDDLDGDGANPCDNDCDETDPERNRAATETCNEVDDNCNSQVDDLSGECSTGAQGICAEGYRLCVDGEESCEPVYSASAEICSDSADDDCDGQVDEADCQDWGIGETCSNPIPITANQWIQGGLGNAVRNHNVPCAPAGTGDHVFALEVTGESQEIYLDIDESAGDSFVMEVAANACESDRRWQCIGPRGFFATRLPQGKHFFFVQGTGNYRFRVVTRNAEGECSVPDSDSDGHTICDGDCREGDATVYPDAEEICDGKDNNCNDSVDEVSGTCNTQQPGICASGRRACEDGNELCTPTVAAGEEVCGDGQDNDCNGQTDEGSCVVLPAGETCANAIALELNTTFEGTLDGRHDFDGPCYNDPAAADQIFRFEITAPQGQEVVFDLDAESPYSTAIHVLYGFCGAIQDYNQQRWDCFGGQQPIWRNYLSAGTYYVVVSGFGGYKLRVVTVDPETGECAVPDSDDDGVTICQSDCDDADSSVYPEATEVCDGKDNNCNNEADEISGSCTTNLQGICSSGVRHCGDNGEECLPVLAPGEEVCNDSRDNNCDGRTDEAGCVNLVAGETCYNAITIVDGVTYSGNLANARADYDHPCAGSGLPDHVFRLDIADAGNGSWTDVFVDAEAGEDVYFEIWEGACQPENLRDCYGGFNGTFSTGMRPGVYFISVVGTGSYSFRLARRGPPDHTCTIDDGDGDGVTLCDYDCDDGDPNVRPGAPEVCDGKDNDCNHQVDDLRGLCNTGMPGVCQRGTQACVQGQAACMPAVTAGPEICNDGQDNNCDGRTDEQGCTTAFPGESCTNAIDVGIGGVFAASFTGYRGDLPNQCYDISGVKDVFYRLVIDEPTPVVFVGRNLQDSWPPPFWFQFGQGTCGDWNQLQCYEGRSNYENYFQPGVYFLQVQGTDEYLFSVALRDPQTWACRLPDGDGDGQTICDYDCDDNDPDVSQQAQESCNGIDDNCDGGIDNVYGPCNTGLPGVCATGNRGCEGSQEICYPQQSPNSEPELCNDRLDNDCDGQVDEMGCVQVPPGARCTYPIQAQIPFTTTLSLNDFEDRFGTCFGQPGGDAFIEFTPTATRQIQVTLTPRAGGDADAVLVGGECNNLYFLECIEGSSTFTVEAGRPYRLIVNGQGAVDVSIESL